MFVILHSVTLLRFLNTRLKSVNETCPRRLKRFAPHHSFQCTLGS